MRPLASSARSTCQKCSPAPLSKITGLSAASMGRFCGSTSTNFRRNSGGMSSLPGGVTPATRSTSRASAGTGATDRVVPALDLARPPLERRLPHRASRGVSSATPKPRNGAPDFGRVSHGFGQPQNFANILAVRGVGGKNTNKSQDHPYLVRIKKFNFDEGGFA